MVVKLSVLDGQCETISAMSAPRQFDHTKPAIAMNAMPYVTTCTRQRSKMSICVRQAATTCINKVLTAAVKNHDHPLRLELESG